MPAGTKVQLMGSAAGTNTITTLFFRAPYDPNTASVMAQRLEDDFIRKLNSYQSSSFTWTNIRIGQIDSGGQSPYNKAINRPGASSGLLPMQLAYVVHLFSGFVGLGNRGRFFWPAVPPGYVANGFTSATFNTSFLAALDIVKGFWVGASATYTYRWVIYSRKDNVLKDVSLLGFSTILGTLRSRRFGTGI